MKKEWADRMSCVHGPTFNEECLQCELAGIKESLQWMKRKVARDEKRLKEIEGKYNN